MLISSYIKYHFGERLSLKKETDHKPNDFNGKGPSSDENHPRHQDWYDPDHR